MFVRSYTHYGMHQQIKRLQTPSFTNVLNAKDTLKKRQVISVFFHLFLLTEEQPGTAERFSR